MHLHCFSSLNDGVTNFKLLSPVKLCSDNMPRYTCVYTFTLVILMLVHFVSFVFF